MGRFLLGLGVLSTIALGQGAGGNGPRTLKSVYGTKFSVGAAISAPLQVVGELRLFKDNFTALTPENCMKIGPIHPGEKKYQFGPADDLVAWAATNGVSVNGHTLVWHAQCPDWFFTDNGAPASKETLLARMREHIATVAGRYKGKVVSWDVVNEAIDDGKGYLRNSPWYQIAGEDFIPEAFKAAALADPGAALYYNDYNIELPSKRAKTLDLIRDIRAKGGVIHGVGIQAHWGLTGILNGQVLTWLEDSIVAFHSAGLKVMLTELDIDVVPRKASGAEVGTKEASGDDPFVKGFPEVKQQELAQAYGLVFALLNKHAEKIDRVTFWGLHDGKTWLNSWPRKRTNHPLLWARDLTPKPAYEAVLKAGG